MKGHSSISPLEKSTTLKDREKLKRVAGWQGTWQGTVRQTDNLTHQKIYGPPQSDR